MPTLLALDTATEACSVALLHQNRIYSCYEVIPRLHAQQILPMINQVLNNAGCDLQTVDALIFGCGPGAFTGVRIAAGIVQGLAFALDKPVIPISNLALIAQRAWREYQLRSVAVAIDARMDEIYWGCYTLQGSEMILMGDEQVIAPHDARLPDNSIGWAGVGTGWKYVDQIAVNCYVKDIDFLPCAEDLLSLGVLAWQQKNIMIAENVEPTYLRNNVAMPKK